MVEGLINSSEANQQAQYFCFLYLNNVEQAILALLALIALIIFAVVTFRQYSLMKRRINQNIRIIYWTVAAYYLIYLVKIIGSETLYWLDYSNIVTVNNQTNSMASRFVFFFQFFQLYIFQYMLLMVSYNWQLSPSPYFRIGNIIAIFKYLLDHQFNHKYLRKQKVVLKVIKYFLLIRTFQIIIIIPFMFYNNALWLSMIVKICLALSIIQQFFVICILLVQIYLMRNNQKLKQILQENDSRDMAIKYSILVLLILARTIWVGYFVFRANNFVDQFCLIDKQLLPSYWMKDSVLFIIKSVLQFLAIIRVVLLYRIKPHQMAEIQGKRQSGQRDQTLLTYT